MKINFFLILSIEISSFKTLHWRVLSKFNLLKNRNCVPSTLTKRTRQKQYTIRQTINRDHLTTI